MNAAWGSGRRRVESQLESRPERLLYQQKTILVDPKVSRGWCGRMESAGTS